MDDDTQQQLERLHGEVLALRLALTGVIRATSGHHLDRLRAVDAQHAYQASADAATAFATTISTLLAPPDD